MGFNITGISTSKGKGPGLILQKHKIGYLFIQPFVIDICNHKSSLQLDWFQKGLLEKYGFLSIVIGAISSVFIPFNPGINEVHWPVRIK